MATEKVTLRGASGTRAVWEDESSAAVVAKEESVQARSFAPVLPPKPLGGSGTHAVKSGFAYESGILSDTVDLNLVPFGNLLVSPETDTLGAQSFSPATVAVERGLAVWPRGLQLVSLCLTLAAVMLAAADVISAGMGLIAGSLGLSAFFFGNFAAHRRGVPNWIVGPAAAAYGTWGAFVIALAVAVNALGSS